MARDHARIRLDIWGDDDWRDLTSQAQWLYLHLLSSPSMTFAGVADWRPARIAGLTSDLRADDVLDLADELQDGRFVLADESTEEVLVRSFVKHDGLLRSPNMSKALRTAHAEVSSQVLREVIVGQLVVLNRTQPELKGWVHLEGVLERRSATFEEGVQRLSRNPSGNPSPNPSGKGSGNPSGTREANPSGNPSVTPTPSPTPNSLLLTPAGNGQRATYPDEFEEFWDAYPRKEKKRTAFAAFTKALERAHFASIIEGALAYRDDPNREDAYTQHPTTWLNADGWENDPLPERRPSGRPSTPADGDWWQAQMDAAAAHDQQLTAPHPFRQIGTAS